MIRNNRLQVIAVLAIGGLVGYAAASSRFDVLRTVDAGPSQIGAVEKAVVTPLSTVASRASERLCARPARRPL